MMRWTVYQILVIVVMLLMPIATVAAAETEAQRIENLEKKLEGYEKLLEEAKNFRESLQQQAQQFHTDVQSQWSSMYQTFTIFLMTLSVILVLIPLYISYKLWDKVEKRLQREWKMNFKSINSNYKRIISQRSSR